MSELEPGPSRTETVLLAGIYVVPLTLSIAFLAYVGLPGLALALLAVEAMVSAMVVAAKRPRAGLAGSRSRSASSPSRRASAQSHCSVEPS